MAGSGTRLARLAGAPGAFSFAGSTGIPSLAVRCATLAACGFAVANVVAGMAVRGASAGGPVRTLVSPGTSLVVFGHLAHSWISTTVTSWPSWSAAARIGHRISFSQRDSFSQAVV